MSSPGTAATSSREVLNSWKEIAAYLNRGVRTVQRWEAELNLPVRRPYGRSRGTVIAMRSDLDFWLKTAPFDIRNESTSSPSPRVESNVLSQFLLTEVECGFTFAEIAASAKPWQKEKFVRNMKNACLAYSTVLRYWHRLEVGDRSRTHLNAGMQRLGALLQKLAYIRVTRGAP